MKNNHTQLTRLAAISLVVVMCLSALPMFIPSVAAEDPTPEGRGYVCITFDNGYASDYTIAYPLMSAAGIPGTSFVTTNFIGQPDYMTVEQLQALEANGWEIGAHSVTHKYMTDITPEEVLYEMNESKAVLEGYGLTIDTWAYPGGLQNETTRDIGDDIYQLQRGVGQILTNTVHAPTYYTHITQDMRMVYAENPHSFHQFKEMVDGAIATNSLLILYWHQIHEDGTIHDSLRYTDGIPFTIQEVVEYIQQKMVTDGLTPVQFRDIRNIFDDDNVVRWTASGDGVASEGENWDTGVAPGDGDYLFFPDGSTANCIIDTNANYSGIYLSPDYKGIVTVAPGVELSVGEGGILVLCDHAGNSFVVGDGLITTSGHIVSTNSQPIKNMNVRIVGTGVWLYTGGTGGLVNSLRVSGHTILPMRVYALKCTIDEGARLTLLDGIGISNGLVQNTYTAGWVLDNQGIIDGDGDVIFVVDKDVSISLGTILCDVSMAHRYEMHANRKLTMTGPAMLGSLTIYSDQPYTITLDLNGHEMQVVNGVTLGQRGIIGNGTVYASSWDSSTGTLLDGTDIILRDGGTVKLAPGQSFNRLEVASDDGRTASWTMTATGAQAPIVTGLDAGKDYLWYLDGVEQGEIEAGEDGTIALSYESTGLHTLEVKPTPMTLAMDGLAAAVGIIVALAVLGGVLGMLGKAFGRLKF
jgi:peptidoglycan/xylan/chitin deacetylase (PgdA/CDA1 family)